MFKIRGLFLPRNWGFSLNLNQSFFKGYNIITHNKGDRHLPLDTKILVFLILAFILTKLPIVGRYFAIANTLIHEVGHQLASLLTFGKPQHIKLFSNTEGVAFTRHRFWIGKFITSLAGYVFSSFIACTFFILIFRNRYDIVIYILLAILGISLVFWVRNWYGFFWILTFSGGFAFLLWNADGPIIEYVVLFLVSIIFIESISSAYDIMYLSFKNPAAAGDAQSLSQLTYLIPTQVWGVLFFAQSLFFGWVALKNLIPF